MIYFDDTTLNMYFPFHRYRTFWVNRAGAPLEELDVKPHREGKTLLDVLNFVKENNSAASAELLSAK